MNLFLPLARRLYARLRHRRPATGYPLWALVPRPAPGSVARAWSDRRYDDQNRRP